MPLQAITAAEPIPGYRICERIGAGGYGEVWRVEAPGGLAKAIKFVYGHLDEDRASRELKALNRIKTVRHPFLVSLERIEVVDGQLLIVTELAEASLKERHDACRKEGMDGIPRVELLQYMRDSADALDFMSQEHSLQHLDIKPENLLMLAGRVKVADFGLVKDIHDATASLMGGLTPLYAPPEVFDNRPSHQSDQYSLAIVYQEMLTGELPFPGTTAIQLARQHLNARPRLSALPEYDQPAIARALSKIPADRFDSCGELVDALCRATDASAVMKSASSGYGSASDRVAGGAHSSDSDKPSAWTPTAEREGLSETGETLGSLTSSPLPFVDPTPAASSLPPIELENLSVELRPTLFLGAGRSASRVLARLKRRLEDQFGDLNQVPIFQTLVLDTDGKDLLENSQDHQGEVLQSHETMALPLRRPQDYRNDSRQLLKWLSRRWLYNIPRSLKTEGLRPLGRLALIDHAPEVLKRLRHAMHAAVDPESMTQSHDATGLSIAERRPRIVVVSSISGGTGGGMVADLAYLARYLLGSMGFADDQVSGVLLHSTGRDPRRVELEMVNAYSTLSELNHFSRLGSFYSGEAAFELPPRTGDNQAFQDTYLVHLGNEMDDDRFENELKKVADYLFLDSASTAHSFFQACRQAEPRNADCRNGEIRVRTFGLHRISCLEDRLINETVEHLCRQAVDRWLVGRQTALRQPVSCASTPSPEMGSAEPESAEIGSTSSDPADDPDGNQTANQSMESLNLDVETLIEGAIHCIEDALGKTCDTFFREELLGLPAGKCPDSPESNALAIAHTTQFLDAMIGSGASHNEPENSIDSLPGQVKLVSLLADFRDQATATQVDAIRSWILAQIETGARVRGAQQLARSVAEHCKTVTQQAIQLQQRAAADAVQIMTNLESFTVARSRAQSRRAHDSFHAAIMQYCRHRLFISVVESVLKIISNVKSQVARIEDDLLDLSRDLQHLMKQFSSTSRFESPTSETSAASNDAAGDLRDSVAEMIGERFEELADRFDQQLERTILQQGGGLRKLFSAGEVNLHQLPMRLRAAARSTAVSMMKHLDTTSMLFKGEGHDDRGTEMLRECLASATPPLLKCGGAHRLLAVLPVSTDPRCIEQLNEQLNETPSITQDDGGDFILCREVEQISLTQVAVAIIDGRRDLAESAERLHTRSDVQWSKLPDIT